jgi:hypothetical protein
VQHAAVTTDERDRMTGRAERIGNAASRFDADTDRDLAGGAQLIDQPVDLRDLAARVFALRRPAIDRDRHHQARSFRENRARKGREAGTHKAFLVKRIEGEFFGGEAILLCERPAPAAADQREPARAVRIEVGRAPARDETLIQFKQRGRADRAVGVQPVDRIDGSAFGPARLGQSLQRIRPQFGRDRRFEKPLKYCLGGSGNGAVHPSSFRLLSRLTLGDGIMKR